MTVFDDFDPSFKEAVLTTLCNEGHAFYEASRAYHCNGACVLAERQRSLGNAYIAAALSLGWGGIVPTLPPLQTEPA